MQEIKAYVREQMLDHVIDELAAVPGLPGIAVAHLREFGHATEDGRLVKTDMAKLEIDVSDSLVESVVRTIVEHGRTDEGHPGDGKVFVSELRQAIRIADGRQDH